MRYTVVWLPDAERELARIYNQAADKQAVASAADEIDRALTRFPLLIGESRYDDMRIVFEKPLIVTYRVLKQDRRVEVIRVRSY